MESETEQALSALLGRVKAMEYGMRFLISAHPKPELLRRLWPAMLPLIVDCHEDATGLDAEAFHKAFHEGLALISQTIEANPKGLR